MKHNICKAEIEDASAMYNISRAAHRSEDYRLFIPPASLDQFIDHYRWSKDRKKIFVEKIRMLLADSTSTVLVAKISNTIVGYTISSYDSPSLLSLKGLFVRPVYQGRGIGKALFIASYQHATAGTVIELEVLDKNIRAKLLYENQGFMQVRFADKLFFGAKLTVMVKKVN